jgi:hypothetical protein
VSGDPAGRVTSAFRPASDPQTTTGTNPDAPPVRSASVAADAPPMASRCVIGPASGLDTGNAADPYAEPY